MAEDPREHRYGLVSGGLELRGEDATKSQVSSLFWVWEIHPQSSKDETSVVVPGATLS